MLSKGNLKRDTQKSKYTHEINCQKILSNEKTKQKNKTKNTIKQKQHNKNQKDFLERLKTSKKSS